MRPPHIHVLRVRARSPGCADGTSLCLRRTGALPVRHPAGVSAERAPHPRVPFGAHPARTCRRSKQLDLASSEATMAAVEAELFPGPLCCGAGRTIRPAGWAQRIAPTCRRAKDGASASPAGPHGFFVHGGTKNAAPGWPFLGPPFFGHAKKGGSPARQAGEKRQGCQSANPTNGIKSTAPRSIHS